MKKIFLMVNILALASCASMYRHPESIEEKMARYKSRKTSSNPIPHYQVAKYKYKASRNPASASQEELNINNKNIYFLSLYEQYDAFAQIYPDYKKPLKYCPFFHQDLLSYKETPKKWKWDKKTKVNTAQGVLSAIIDVDDKRTEKTAIKSHMDRNYDELVELCDKGSSDNYYIYENMITLSKKKGVIKRDTEGLNSLLKTTLFFNETLLHEVGHKNKVRAKSRGIASTKSKVDYTNEALTRVKASWAKEYYLNK